MNSGTTSFPKLALKLDRASRVPLYVQIEASIRTAILEKRLRRGAALPSTRVLASRLGVSRNTVIQAYEDLAADGYLETGRGRAARVRSSRGGAPAGVHWRLLLRGSGCPERSVVCGDPDGIGLYVFSAAGRQ